jgi:pimeloyl-ACP methyl ester carboxylesterase
MLALGGVVAVALLFLLAKNRGLITFPDRTPDINASYLGTPPHNRPSAVVFVHGIFGSKRDTWVGHGRPFPELLASDPEFQNQVDVFVYEFFTPKFGSANSIVGLAAQLAGSLEDHHVFEDHKRVAFLSYSMGGLVVREFLLIKHPDLRSVPLLRALIPARRVSK